MATNNPLDNGGKPDHVTLGLGLPLAFHVILGRTVLPLGEGRVIPLKTGYFSPSLCSIVIKGKCWALAEECALLSALLGISRTNCVAMNSDLRHTGISPSTTLRFLAVAETFCYLGSGIHLTGSLDDEITARLLKATAAFGCLRKRLWDEHVIRVEQLEQQSIDTAKIRRATRIARTNTSTSTSYIM